MIAYREEGPAHVALFQPMRTTKPRQDDYSTLTLNTFRANRGEKVYKYCTVRRKTFAWPAGLVLYGGLSAGSTDLTKITLHAC
jgi:hypothetical protein